MKVVLASNNEHKLKEIKAILSQLGMDVISQREAGISLEPVEDGTTFEENSFIKAKAIMDACGLPTIADDSGLEVDALNGEPGIFSARYGGDINETDDDRVNYLLKNMENIPDDQRTARFVCVITMLTPDGKKIVSRGECNGSIMRYKAGENGFGYDPVFFYEPKNCSLAELSDIEKNKVSHRYFALKGFAKEAKEIFK